MKKLRYKIEYILAYSFSRILAYCPRGVFRPVAWGVARIMYLIPQMGRVSMQNLAVVFPEKSVSERRGIAKRSLENLVMMLQEFFWVRRRPGIVATRLVNAEEMEPEFRAVYDPRGSISFTPHLGNWEFAGISLAERFGFSLATVVRSPRNPYLDRLISAGRAVNGVKIVYSQRAAYALHHALKHGTSIGVLIDQNTRVRDGGDFVEFFGLPVPVSMLPAHLARAGDRKVGIGAVVREGKNFRVLYQKLPRASSEYESDRALTQDVMRISEEMIRAYPDQYLWMYKRFQNIPRDAAEEIAARYPAYSTRVTDRFYDRKLRGEKPAAH